MKHDGRCPGNQEKSGKVKRAKMVEGKSGNLRKNSKVREKPGNFNSLSERKSRFIPYVQMF